MNRKLSLLSLLLPALPLGAFGAPLSFNRDVKPVLAEACFHCHGPDSVTRKAGLRLDTEQGLFGQNGSDAAVVPGKPMESPLYTRLITEDPEDRMPPLDSHKELKPEEIELLRRWIDEGAPWQPHWSFVAPEPVAEPEVSDPAWVRTPIDRFVLAALDQAGLTPAPEADRRALARRVSLDLTGLPPSPEEVEGFVADTDPQAYEKLIDRMLASPHWGEHRGRYWLDAARYADTHGLHFDNYREMWPYRDWVIEAFNRNQPFDQFTLEQIAGDLLPHPSESQLIATGFQRCNMTTNEGGTIDEENLALYAADRVQTIGWVYLGLTLNCAQCHDHKFDPITMVDHYAMAAYFRNTTQGPKDGNVKDSGPVLVLPEAADRPRWEALPGEIAAAEKRRADRREAAKPGFQSWLASVTPENLEAEADRSGLLAHFPLNEGQGGEFRSRVATQENRPLPEALAWSEGGPWGPAPVLKQGATPDFGELGNFAAKEAFTLALWFRPSSDEQVGALVARMDDAAQHRGWDLLQQGRSLNFHLIESWPDKAIKVTSQRPALNAGRWHHVVLSYDGSGKAAGVRLYVNAQPVPLRVLNDSLPDGADTRSPTPLRLGQRSSSLVNEDGQVQDLRIFSRALAEDQVGRLQQQASLRSALAAGAGRNPDQTERLLAYYLATRDEEWKQFDQAVAKLEGERAAIRARSPVTHIQEEKRDSPAMAHVLMRGAYDQPGELVAAAPPAVLHPLPEGAPANRLGLAQWLIDPANPLTARVTVNRFWQELFGTGLVATPDDFGIMGAPPSHPELLDWLARYFIESGWDVKALFRTILLSSTYRQSVLTSPEKLQRDPDNRLLSRGPRFRMDGEMIRDLALAASGTLSSKRGGPGTKPYQPENIWEVVGMGNARYEQDKGENLYRRTVYNYWKRMAPPASMEIFNAPNREVSCTKRDRTNTPLQALVTLNDPQFVEAARRLAELALKQGQGDEAKTLDLMSRRILSRPLREAETNLMASARHTLLTHYQSAPEDAKALLSVGEAAVDASLDPVQLASWTMVCSQLMNLDEALCK